MLIKIEPPVYFHRRNKQIKATNIKRNREERMLAEKIADKLFEESFAFMMRNVK